MSNFNYILQILITVSGAMLSFKEFGDAVKSGKWWRFFLLILIPIFSLGSIGLTYFSDQTQDKTINDLNKKLSVTEKYQYIARLTPTGSEQLFFPASDPNHSLIPEGLPQILIGSYFFTDNYSVEYNCDLASQNKHHKAIEVNPDFPFSYLALVHCGKQENADNWREYAQKAEDIFLITTKIGGHNDYHDVGLEFVQKML